MYRPICLVLIFFLAASFPGARSSGQTTEAVSRGISYLKQASREEKEPGESALAVLALTKAGVSADDPSIAPYLKNMLKPFSGSSYNSRRSGGHEVYEAAVLLMALISLQDNEYREQIQAVANFLIGRQKQNGSWDYPHRSAGDTSIAQYAVLALWEAENAGVRIPPQVWDRAARWFLSVQAPGGSWNYHRDEGARWPETISMTAAGVGSLYICQMQLAPYRRQTATPSPLLTPLLEGQQIYKVGVSEQAINEAVRKGLNWIGSNYTTSAGSNLIGQTVYYMLYGVERAGALAKSDRIGNLDWYGAGRQYLLSSQTGGGGWSAQYGGVANTSWALLFLIRATEQSVRRIEVERLGAGTLLGGRGLPEDLSQLAIAQGRVVVRPMGGAIDEMLSVLEDPRAEGADAALAGLIERYHRQGPSALRPYKDRFRKLLEDQDPGIRQLAAWCLARTGDLDVVPALIEALEDEDEPVVATSKIGLQLLSRQIEGPGPAPNANPEEKAEAIQQWRDWFESVRPPDLVGQVLGAGASAR